MKRKKLNVKQLWIQFEDFLLPRLRLSITDRAVYAHLVRHSRLEGQLQLRFSMPWLARGIGISTGPVRESVRRLVVLGALRLIRRSKAGHVVPRARAGRNSYRNLVSSCLECNSLKGERPAADFLRWLYRQRRLTSAEFNDRLRALDALASGKLLPPLQHPDVPL